MPLTGNLHRAATLAAALIFGVVGVARIAHADTPPLGSEVPGGGLFTTGERLSEYCDGKLGDDLENSFTGGTCLGFINGVAEVWVLIGSICYNHVTKGELTDVVVRYMNEHPDEVKRHTAIVLVGIALKAVYPPTPECKKQIGDLRP